tara:strand:+ start:620 stop:1093 length:474 start_codon:yes stop_codon:yes gene_type:complete
MKNLYINIYNNLIKLTRNKKLYLNLEKQDTFSDRLIILFFHFAFFLKIYKSEFNEKNLQDLFDYVIRQIELSIREIGYGDVSVNKKMKEMINLFYSVVEKIESWDSCDFIQKKEIMSNYLNINKNLDFYVDYFEKYRNYVKKNTLNEFSKDIIELKF